MNQPSTFLFFAAAAGIFVASATSQRLATYDPAAFREFATGACASTHMLQSTAQLWARTPSTQNSAGAIAADNQRRRLFTTTGFPADGIDQIRFADIGTGTAPINHAAPPGFNQVTAMVVDPLEPNGSALIVSDGFTIAPYDYAAGVFIVPPQAVPIPAGRTITGLDFDVWTHDLLVVCDDATILRNPIGGGPWSTYPPAVSVPPLATGIAICRSMMSSPVVSFFNGTVMNPQTGAVVPFPGAPLTGGRKHRGMTFFARPVLLGGRGLGLAPQITVRGSYQVGSNDCRIETESGAGLVVVAIDIAPTMTAGPALPVLDGTLFFNPATSITSVFAPGVSSLPLDLTHAPAGVGLVTQAAALGNNVFHLSDALFFQTWL
ncbi:MAG: hypothetical protein VYE77_03400 [Planctomycetota bacterium]|nr:hypothetical protein [Planctomycetota bacterium]